MLEPAFPPHRDYRGGVLERLNDRFLDERSASRMPAPGREFPFPIFGCSRSAAFTFRVASFHPRTTAVAGSMNRFMWQPAQSRCLNFANAAHEIKAFHTASV